MANPFFIPDQGLEGLDRVNRSMGTAGQLYNMKEQVRLADQQNQRLLEQQAYQKPYYEALAQKARESIPASTNPWDTGNLTRMKAKLQLNGVPVDQLRFLKELEPLAADQNVKYGDVASAVSSDWDRHRGGITEDLGVHASKLAAKAATLQPNDPERAKLLQEVDKVAKIQSVFDRLPQERVKEILFPDIYKEEQSARRVVVPQGSAVIDTKTGKAIFQSDKPSRFQTVPPGGFIINPETGEKIEGNPKDVDESVKAARYERIRQMHESRAYKEAARETQLKFNLTPQLIQTATGLQYSFPNHPEAHQFFLNRMDNLKGKYIGGAIKRGALPEDYGMEIEAPPETPQNTTKPPQGFIDSGKTSGGKKVFIDSTGTKAWIAP
jgi:hypothetical protein